VKRDIFPPLDHLYDIDMISCCQTFLFPLELKRASRLIPENCPIDKAADHRQGDVRQGEGAR
jgi:hypothetical protein